MKDALVNKVELAVGLRRDNGRLVSAVPNVAPYRYDFKFPALSPHRSVEVKPVTAGEVIAIHQRVQRRAALGSPQYRRLTYLEHIETRVRPKLTEEQLDELALADYEGLYSFLSTGRGLDGQSAYDYDADDAVTTAWVRLPKQSDHKLAESDAGSTRQNDIYEYQMWLLWHVARFGVLREADFETLPRYLVDTIRSLTWPDFTALVGAALSQEPEDFRLVSSILDGPVKGDDGMTVPFPGVPEPDEEPAGRDGGGEGALA